MWKIVQCFWSRRVQRHPFALASGRQTVLKQGWTSSNVKDIPGSKAKYWFSSGVHRPDVNFEPKFRNRHGCLGNTKPRPGSWNIHDMSWPNTCNLLSTVSHQFQFQLPVFFRWCDGPYTALLFSIQTSKEAWNKISSSGDIKKGEGSAFALHYRNRRFHSTIHCCFWQ